MQSDNRDICNADGGGGEEREYKIQFDRKGFDFFFFFALLCFEA